MHLPPWTTELQHVDLDNTVSPCGLKPALSHPVPNSSEIPPSFPVVALGGTFDHLHSGHKILLSMAAWIATEKAIVGVTGAHMLRVDIVTDRKS